ncbi:unnamed protein product [Rhizoctonia solani]|uniref:Ssl1-like domain-containing protein n=1 Tax=Rhizoctonia solani TaxID=456999 RepID=A0A8H3DCF7_9AGAM|nr:unnamed protein product [Rhizoctonia solani]
MAPRDDVSSGSEAGMEEGSDVEYTENNNGAAGTGEKGKGKQPDKKGKNKSKDQGYSWEANYVRSWDQVQEDEGGNLAHSVDDLIARKRRQRLLGPSSAIRRAIIRHLVLLVDLSAAMADRDLRPTRFELALDCARAFVVEWCEQNPLGQIGVVGMRAGIGERIVEMTGGGHRRQAKTRTCGGTEFTKRNRGGPGGHLPTHSSREIVIIFGSLTTCDPGDIYETLDSCVKDKIRISLVALAAEMKICRELCQKTEGTFGVALNEGHFKDLLFEHIPPPAHRAARGGNESLPAKSTSLNPNADLMLMGFPTRLPPTSAPTLCAWQDLEQGTAGFLNDGDDQRVFGFAPHSFSCCSRSPSSRAPFHKVLSTTMIARTFALALGAVLPLVALAGNITEGGACSQSNTYLTPGSYQLNTDCDAMTYCNGSGVCAKKRCRKDEFPFGYGTTEFKDLPRMCPSGQFCPDEEDECQNILSVGSACQLNRDDECEPAPDTSLSTIDNHRGAICLNYQCMWQNVTVGQACVVENIPYIAYSVQGEFVNIVSRGNCRKGLYCDAAQKICIATQDYGSSCTADKECTSGNCLDNLTCGFSTDAPRKLAVWIYVVVAIAIVGGMLLTVGTLFMIHRKERDEIRQQREQYWREQAALRQNILQMRETAQASLLSLPYNGQNQSGSGYNSPSRHSSMASGKDLGVASDDSHAGFVSHAGYAGGKGSSALRNSLKSEDGQEATETMSMDALVTERENGTAGRKRKPGLGLGGKR